MLNVKRSTVGALSTVALVLCLTLGLAACAPQTSEPGADADGSSAKTTQTAAGDGTGAYVSDEQCLSCMEARTRRWPRPLRPTSRATRTTPSTEGTTPA